MSYTDVFSLNELICPYCKRSASPSQMTPFVRVELDCEECGHRHHANRDGGKAGGSITYLTTPDCELNGFEHDIITKTSKGQDYMFCAVCDKEA